MEQGLKEIVEQLPGGGWLLAAATAIAAIFGVSVQTLVRRLGKLVGKEPLDPETTRSGIAGAIKAAAGANTAVTQVASRHAALDARVATIEARLAALDAVETKRAEEARRAEELARVARTVAAEMAAVARQDRDHHEDPHDDEPTRSTGPGPRRRNTSGGGGR